MPVGVQPDGTAVFLNARFYGSPLNVDVTVYLVPQQARKASQVTTLNLALCSAGSSRPSGDVIPVLRPDGKFVIFNHFNENNESAWFTVVDLHTESCYPLPRIAGLQLDYAHFATFTPDSRRLLLLDRKRGLATLDTTHGMGSVKLVGPITPVPFAHLDGGDDDDGGYNELIPTAVANDGSMGLVRLNDGFFHDDDFNDDGPDQIMVGYALFNMTPGASPLATEESATFFSGEFGERPIPLANGKYLVAYAKKQSSVEVYLLSAQTGALLQVVSVVGYNPIKLCALSTSNEAVLFLRSYAHLISVQGGGSAADATLSVQEVGTPTGVLPVLSCSATGSSSSGSGRHVLLASDADILQRNGNGQLVVLE